MTKHIALVVAAATAFASLIPGAPVRAAEEVLYCEEKAAQGFVWGNNRLRSVAMKLDPNRHLVRTISETEKEIKTTTGDKKGQTTRFTCSSPDETTLTCNNENGTRPWNFYGDQFVYSILDPPAVSGGSREIVIAYGTCSKF